MPRSRSIVDRLAALNEFADDEKSARLRDLESEARVYEPDDDVVRTGEENGGIHLVHEGWCCRYRALPDGRRHILGFHLPGDFVGLDSVYMKTSPDTVTSLTQASVSTVSSKALLGLCREAPAVAQAMLSEMARESALANERMISLGRRTAYERMAHMLLELSLRLKRESEPETTAFQMPLSGSLLADAAGLTTVHVNRTLRRLQEEGLIAVDDGNSMVVRLDDLDGLARASRFGAEAIALLSRRQPRPQVPG